MATTDAGKAEAAGGSPADVWLDQAKRMARALTGRHRELFVLWVARGMPDEAGEAGCVTLDDVDALRAKRRRRRPGRNALPHSASDDHVA